MTTDLLIIVLSWVGWIVAVLAAAYSIGIAQHYYNDWTLRIVQSAFYFGMGLKRRRHRLNWWQRVLAYVYVGAVFLPLDFYLQFKAASEQMEVRPRFELTTSLINRHLHADAATDTQIAERQFVIDMRAFLDARGRSPKEGKQACVALQYFDLIDTRQGDTDHFNGANLFRSQYDPDKTGA